MRLKEQEQKSQGKIEKLRAEAIERFFNLTDKVLDHIKWSIKADKPCMHCDINGNAKAKDENNLCAMCHGTKLVPDTIQRNWATDEVITRIAPAPKAVEMSVEQKSIIPELEEEVKKLSKEDLDKQLSALGIIFKETNEP